MTKEVSHYIRNYSVSADDKIAISEYINLLRANNIFLDLYIYDEGYFYSIFIKGGANIIDNDNIVEGIYNIDKKYRGTITKSIHVNYDSSYNSKKEITDSIKQRRVIIDMTNEFHNATQGYKNGRYYNT